MRAIWPLVLLFVVMGAGPLMAEGCPVILVHGLFGWGRDEMGANLYWGGRHFDVEAHLRSLGHRAHTASVGPVSSNHDRACELFAQIKGLRCDYGAEHSERYGHARWGRSYEGFHPEWSAEHPVDLLGHSLGGLTARKLVQLLEADFWGLGTSASWVRSVTTLATPHDGSTLMGLVESLGDGFAEKLVAASLGAIGTRSERLDYDCDLDQWGLRHREGESIRDFLRRIDTTVGDRRDLAPWSVGREGARAFNEEVPTFEGVTYLSWATQATRRSRTLWGHHVPVRSMTLAPLKLCAMYMGAYAGKDVEGVEEAWWPNDGQTNTISCLAPEGHARREYDGTLQPGTWNVMGVVPDCDHTRIIGCFRGPEDLPFLKSFYAGLSAVLHRLDS